MADLSIADLRELVRMARAAERLQTDMEALAAVIAPVWSRYEVTDAEADDRYLDCSVRVLDALEAGGEALDVATQGSFSDCLASARAHRRHGGRRGDG